MSNKLKLSYLTLLVVLTGALVLAPVVTATADSLSDQDTGGSYITDGANRVVIQQVQFSSTGSSSTIMSFKVIDNSSASAFSDTDINNTYIYKEDGVTPGFQNGQDNVVASKTSSAGFFSADWEPDSTDVSVPAGQTATFYLVVDMADSVGGSVVHGDKIVSEMEVYSDDSATSQLGSSAVASSPAIYNAAALTDGSAPIASVKDNFDKTGGYFVEFIGTSGGNGYYNTETTLAEDMTVQVKTVDGAGDTVTTKDVTASETGADTGMFTGGSFPMADLNPKPGYKMVVTDKANELATDASYVTAKLSLDSSSYALAGTMTITVKDDSYNDDPDEVDDLGDSDGVKDGSSVAAIPDASFTSASGSLSATDFTETDPDTGVFTYSTTPKALGYDAAGTIQVSYSNGMSSTPNPTSGQSSTFAGADTIATSASINTTAASTTDIDYSNVDREGSTKTNSITVTVKDPDKGGSSVTATDVVVVENVTTGEKFTWSNLSFSTDTADKVVNLGTATNELAVSPGDELEATYTDPNGSGDTSSDTAMANTTVVRYDSAGTEKEKYVSIERAEDNAGASDVIKVYGDYATADERAYEESQIKVTHNVTIKAADGASPVIDYSATSQNVFYFEVSGTATIDGLEIVGGDGKNVILASSASLTGTVEVKNSTIKVNDTTSSSTTAGIYINGADADFSVEDNVFTTGSAGLLTTATIEGVWVEKHNDSSQDLIVDNEFKNLTIGVHFTTQDYKVAVKNNYFHDLNYKESILLGDANSSGTWDITGNIFEDVVSGVMTVGTTGTADIYFNNFINADKPSKVSVGYTAYPVGNSGGKTLNIGQNWWGAKSGPVAAQLGTNLSVSDAEPYLTAKVDATKFAASGSVKLDAKSTVGAYIDSPTNGGEQALVNYAAYPHTEPVDGLSYYRVHDDDSNDDATTLRFYTGNPNAVALYWNGSEWVKASNQVYDAEGGYVAVTLDSSLTPATVPDETGFDSVNGYSLDFALAGPPAGSYGRAMDVVQGWQMIGLGFSPDDTAPSAVFGDHVGAVFEWDPSANEYVKASEAASVGPEIGYWFYSSSEQIVGLGTGANVEADYEIVFGNTGWMMFSVPFDTFWNEVRFGDSLDTGDKPKNAAALAADKVYTYKPDIEGYGDAVAGLDDSSSDVGLLKANKGYWIEIADNYATPVKMQVPFNPSSRKPSKMTTAAAADTSKLEAGTSTPPAPPAAPQAVAGELKATAAVSSGSVTFQVSGADVQSINVQVFNVNGEEIFSKSASGNSLSWNANVANGIYLYGVSAKVNGTVKPLGVQKLLVLQ